MVASLRSLFYVYLYLFSVRFIIIIKRTEKRYKLQILLLLASFSHQSSLMVFRWSLSDSRSSQVFRSLLSILADLNNAVVWMVSIRPLISKFSTPFTKHLGIVLSASVTIGIPVIFVFHSFFFSSRARFKYLSPFSLYFIFVHFVTKSVPFLFLHGKCYFPVASI